MADEEKRKGRPRILSTPLPGSAVTPRQQTNQFYAAKARMALQNDSMFSVLMSKGNQSVLTELGRYEDDEQMRLDAIRACKALAGHGGEPVWSAKKVASYISQRRRKIVKRGNAAAVARAVSRALKNYMEKYPATLKRDLMDGVHSVICDVDFGKFRVLNIDD